MDKELKKTWQTRLRELNEKALRGQADRDDRRTILLLMTLLHLLPSDVWWVSEV